MSSLADLLVSYKQVKIPNTEIEQQKLDFSDRLDNLRRFISTKIQSEEVSPKASDEEQIDYSFKSWYLGNPTSNNSSTPSTQKTIYSPNLTRNNSLNSNAKRAYNYFIENGLSKAAAAGIVGNLYHENLANPSQTINDSRGTTALGIAGFNSKGDLPNLQKWCRQNGLRETDFDAQLAYLTHVVKSGRVDLSDPKLTPEQASFIFGRDFERFAGRDGTGRGYKNYDDPEHIKRRKTAIKIYNS